MNSEIIPNYIEGKLGYYCLANETSISQGTVEAAYESVRVVLTAVEILKEEKIRVLAEMENLRKRFEREKIDSIKYGSVNFARDILSPGDNLERALNALPENENHPESIKNLTASAP